MYAASLGGYVEHAVCQWVDGLSGGCAAGAPETEEAICKAGGVPALLALIRSCSEHPDQSALTEPAVIALSNLAAGNEANKEAIMQADALPTLVKILGHQVRFFPRRLLISHLVLHRLLRLNRQISIVALYCCCYRDPSDFSS